MEAMVRFTTSLGALGALSLGACSPALDWREFAPTGSGVVMSFPCRPDRHARVVTLGQAKVTMEMLVCEAGGATFAVSFVDASAPEHVTGTISSLNAALAANVKAGQAERAPARVAGMTPNTEAVRLAFSGRLPDGSPVKVDAEFFAKGLRVYQATVISAKTMSGAAEPFFAALKFPS